MDNTNDISTILFAISSIAAGFIAYRCSTSPNPKPAHAEKDDVLFNQSFGARITNLGISFGKHLFIVAGFLAAILCLDYDNATAASTSTPQHSHQNPSSPIFGLLEGKGKNVSRVVCPHFENLEREFIKPTTFSVTCLATAIGFGLLRLEAFRQLGGNFTFQLAKPSGLMTSGLYAWVQHPSYTAMAGFVAALFALWFQPMGVMGCFLRPGVARSGWFLWGFRVLCVFDIGWIFWGRVRQEEGMLKREFGREWVLWHGRTKRFVPGVF